MKPRTALLAIAAFALVAAPSLSEPGKGGRHGHHGGGPPVYDLAGETTLAGIVAEILPQSCPRAGIHLRLTTATGDVEVGLGPSSFLAELGASFAVGDEISVTGAKPTNDAPVDFLARTVVRGDASFVLRDDQGLPQWAGDGQGCSARKGRGLHRRSRDTVDR